MLKSSTQLARLRPSLATNLALLGGLMLTVAMPPFLATVVPALLGLMLAFQALIVSDRPGRTAWVFGLVHQASLLHWLFFLDPSKSIPSRALVPVQAVAAIAYVSLFYLGMGWVFGRVRRRLGEPVATGLLPLMWVAMETARGGGELGFPWCLSGATLAGGFLQFLYRAAGEAGVGLALATTATATLCWRRLPAGRTVLAALAVAWWALLGAGSQVHFDSAGAAADDGTIAAALIQPNVALADKWVDAKIDSTRNPLTELTGEAARAGARFVVWPETAVPAYLRYDRDLLEWVRRTSREDGIFLFTGFPDAERRPDGTVVRYNSSGLFSLRGNLVHQYAKYHLLPIGEVIPFERYLPWLSRIDLGQAEWSPGPEPEPMVVADGETPFRFGCLICFESAFSPLARQVVRKGARCLVVITNDGWFGHSAGPVQHARLGRIRAVECGVPLLRGANNGISYACDAQGRLLSELGVGRRGFVRADVPIGRADTLYVRAGVWPVWGFLLLWTVAVGFAANRERSAHVA